MEPMTGVVFITFTTLILPGLALLLQIAPIMGISALERLTLAVGLSLSLIPVLYLWGACGWGSSSALFTFVHFFSSACSR
jgi:uncharacterized membrane protein